MEFCSTLERIKAYNVKCQEDYRGPREERLLTHFPVKTTLLDCSIGSPAVLALECKLKCS